MATKAIKSMTLAEAQAYKGELKASGKTQSTSKEFGKLENYIKTLSPEKYGKETVSSAYKQLSSGVTQTGGWTEKNLDTIEAQTGERPKLSAVTTADGLSSYLSDYQSGIYGSKSSVELRDSIAKQLEPAGGAPEVLNRVTEYDKMREQYGVADLEKNLTDLKTQLETEVATTRARTQTAEGGQVAMGVIAGRVGEIERQQNERIDAINRQINTTSNQLNTSYNVISTYMNFMGLDYQDAVTAYNTEFNRNLQIYNLVDAKLDKQVAAARANLQLYTNAITSGNMSYSSLSSSQKAFISGLELQSGLPIGFIGSLQMNAKDKLIYTSSDGSQVAFMDANGKITTQNTGIAPKSSTTGPGATAFNSALMQGRKELEGGSSWQQVYDQIRSAYPTATPDQINAGLGGSWNPTTGEATGWAKGGAYEAFQAKTTTTKPADTVGQDLKDAKAAVDAGASAEEVKRRFLESHPTSSSAWDSYGIY